MDRRILIIGNIGSVYIKDLLDKINSGHSMIDVLDVINAKFKKSTDIREENVLDDFSKFAKLPLFNKIIKLLIVKKFVKKLGKYDCVNIHYIDPVYGVFFSGDFNRLSDRIVSSVWGTDFHGVNLFIRFLQKKIYSLSSVITFNNDDVLDEFSCYYKGRYDAKLQVIRFGLSSLDFIKNINQDKGSLLQYFKLPPGSFIITCGYNGSPNQNHVHILNELALVRNSLPENTIIILPMTYNANPDYISGIESLLMGTGYRFLILKEFLSYSEMAYVRKMTDIFIHLQTHDSFSASMQEHLFSQNVVINGSWLPYQSLKGEGAFFIEVDSFDSLGDTVVNVFTDFKKFKKLCLSNTELIWNLSSWEKNKQKWHDILVS